MATSQDYKTDLQEFLTLAQSHVKNEFKYVTHVRVVLGNESGDPDSVVSSIVYAFYLHYKNLHPDTIACIPVVNFPRCLWRIKPQTKYILNLAAVNDDHLIFNDDLDLIGLRRDLNLELVLVDHHTLREHYEHLQDSVVHIIDHHPVNSSFKTNAEVTIEIVGSCCTLVAEDILSDKTITPDLNILLYATIVLDTANLSPTEGRTTSKDIDVISALENAVQGVDRNTLYTKMVEAKSDLSGLSNSDILEMDMKVICGANVSVAMSSLSVPIEDLVARADFYQDLAKFQRDQMVNAVVIMTLSSSSMQKAQKQLLVYSNDKMIHKQLSSFLETHKNPCLELSPIDAAKVLYTSIYDQNNTLISRKMVLPLIKSFLRDHMTSPLNRTCSAMSDTYGAPGQGHNISISLADHSSGNTNSDSSTIDSIGAGNRRNDSTSEIDPQLLMFGSLSETQTPDTRSPHTPPNSRTSRDELCDGSYSHDLPSFNSAEMVNRIFKKKASLNLYDSDTEGCLSYPYTPPNSFVNSSIIDIDNGVTSNSYSSNENTPVMENYLDLGDRTLIKKQLGRNALTPQNSFNEKKLKGSHRTPQTVNFHGISAEDLEERVQAKQTLLDTYFDKVDDCSDELQMYEGNAVRQQTERSISPFVNVIHDHNFFDVREHGPEFCGSIESEKTFTTHDNHGDRTSNLNNNTSKTCDSVSNKLTTNMNTSERLHDNSCNVIAEKIAEDIIGDLTKLSGTNFLNNNFASASITELEHGINGERLVRVLNIDDHSEALRYVAGQIAHGIVSSALKQVSSESKCEFLPHVTNEVAKDIVRDILSDDLPNLIYNAGKYDDKMSRPSSDSLILCESCRLLSSNTNVLAEMIAREIVEEERNFNAIDTNTETSTSWKEYLIDKLCACDRPDHHPHRTYPAGCSSNKEPVDITPTDYHKLGANVIDDNEFNQLKEKQGNISSTLNNLTGGLNDGSDGATHTNVNDLRRKERDFEDEHQNKGQGVTIFNDSQGDVHVRDKTDDAHIGDKTDNFKTGNTTLAESSNRPISNLDSHPTKSKPESMNFELSEKMKSLSDMLTAEIIKTAVDKYPVSEIHCVEICGSNTKPQRSTRLNQNNCNNCRYSVETEYLPEVDFLKGDIHYATTYKNSLNSYIQRRSLETDNLGDVAVTSYDDISEVTCKDVLKDDTPQTIDVDDLPQSSSISDVTAGDSSIKKSSPPELLFDLPPPQTDYGKKLISSMSLDSRKSNKDKRDVYMTTAGRISVSLDSALSTPTSQVTPSLTRDSRLENEHHQVGDILKRAETLVSDVDAMLACAAFIITQEQNNQEWWDTSEYETKFSDNSTPRGHKRGLSSSSIELVEKMRDAVLKREEIENEIISQTSQASRPTNFESSSPGGRRGKLIPTISITADDDLNGVSPSPTSDFDARSTDTQGVPEDKVTHYDSHDDLDIDTVVEVDPIPVDSLPDDPIPNLSDAEWEILQYDDEAPVNGEGAVCTPLNKDTYHPIIIGDLKNAIDSQAIEPYKNVLTHTGCVDDSGTAVILFCGCYLPDRQQPNYRHVMDSLFLYILNTLDSLIVEKYIIFYFHGATPRRQTPSFLWLRRCYQMIDRRLKKTLCGLYLVHPTLWLKTIVLMSRPFISSKFSSCIKFVKTLTDLKTLVAVADIDTMIPEQIKQYDDCMKQHQSASAALPSTEATSEPPELR